MELLLPGVDEVDSRLDLRRRAANAAERAAICSQDTAFDDGQQSVVLEMGNLLAKARTTAAEHLEHHQKRRGEIAAQIESSPRQSFARAVEGAVEIALRGREEEFKATQRREEQSSRALRAYRLRYRIDRPAHYPEWRVLHWAFVFTLFFVESIANSQFFANASPFGLIGGWLQAAIISATNIGLGLMGGMVVLPWRNRVEVSEKSTKLPTGVAVVIGFFLFVFNLATAHYRVLLEELPTQAITLAMEHLWSSPFTINNFDAWVLLFVGIIFTAVAWIEGYRSDDPLREYGHLSRSYEKARDENAAQKTVIRASAVAQFTERKRELVTTARQAKSLCADYVSQIASSKVDASEYREWRSRMEEATRTLLARYRSYYLQVHKELDPKPGYFSDKYLFPADAPFLEEEERIRRAEARLADLNGIVEELENIRDSGVEQERQVISSLEKAVDDFFKRVAGAAAKESDDANVTSKPAGAPAASDSSAGG